MTNDNARDGIDAIELTRRSALGLAGASAAAWAGGGLLATTAIPAAAEAPLSKVQPDQFYRFTHGDMQITVVSDGYLAFGDIRKQLSGISPEEMKARAEKHFLEIGSTILQENITVRDRARTQSAWRRRRHAPPRAWQRPVRRRLR